MTHRLCALLTPLLLALLLCSATNADAATGSARKASTCKDAGAVPTGRTTSRIRAATLCLVNRERTKLGLSKLKRNRKLERVASRYTTRMVNEEFFSHVSPDGGTLTDRITRTSYLGGSLRRWSLGENIAWGTGRFGTPKSIVAGWMRSAAHRRNILNRRFREAGFGVTAGIPSSGSSSSATTYANVFGQRVRR